MGSTKGSTQKLVSLSLSSKALSCVLGYSRNLTLPLFDPFFPFTPCIYSLRIVDWVIIAFWYHSFGWGPIWLFLPKACFIRNRNWVVGISTSLRKLLGGGVSQGTPSLLRCHRTSLVHLLIKETILPLTELSNGELILSGCLMVIHEMAGP